jgi:hypothetical protein
VRASASWIIMASAPLLTLPAQVVRDSAGVQIVSNEAPLLTATRAWRVDPAPTLRIGGASAAADSLYEFSLVMGVSRLSDGRIAVGVQGSSVVRFFDPSGRFVGSAGRRGQGPGEFAQLLGLSVTRGDTLFVKDVAEIEVFNGRGEWLRQAASRARGPGFISAVVFLDDGSYLGANYPESTVPPAGRSRPRAPLMRVSRDGQQRDTVTQVFWAEQILDGRMQYAFGGFVVFSSGSMIAGDAKRAFVGAPDRREISEYALSGKLQRLIRLPGGLAAVSDEMRRAYRTHALESPGPDGKPLAPAMRARFEQMLERATYAGTLPAFGALVVDKVGNLWAQRYEYRLAFLTAGMPRTPTLPMPGTWDVLDPQGRLLCTVTLPERFTPLEIGDDYVAGLARDEDDVERVEVYRLRKP